MIRKILILSIIFFASCDGTLDKRYSLVFYKNYKTGLCYSMIHLDDMEPNVNTLTCVPCDSLNNVKIDTIR